MIDKFIFGFFVLGLPASVITLFLSIGCDIRQKEDACRERGGVPQSLRGGVVCFAPETLR